MENSGADDAIHEVVIVGAGPAGLWAAFQLGLHGVSPLLIDSRATAGGQCAEFYADKPVYDMPGHAVVEAGEIIDRLLRQLDAFSPIFRFDCQITAVAAESEGFRLGLTSGDSLRATRVVLATGLGALAMQNISPLALPQAARNVQGALAVSTATFETQYPGLYAIGDCAAYPGKLPLLASAFHEAALMAFDIKKKRAGDRRVAPEFSSTSSRLKSLFTER
ncbi:FAD-dependent oxidoreductase [Rhizobium sp. SG_E_25_P2]|uniref:FAD-dependent oxidoreductase n=1 Tax=Rhizobium sp. SG_E_25_P2 TaxID=2879942 RepID=UPI002474BDFA|nr:FAD-dependent oxidoreductase [Rhizobium sp. SG_E_25_P2]